MTMRKSLPGDGQARRVKLWTVDAPTGSTAEKLLKVYLGAFAAIDALDAAKATIASNPELTDVGRQKQIKESIFRETVPAMHRGQIELAKARQEVETRRAALIPPKADPTDAAAAVRRQEIRAFLRGLDDKGRDAFLKKSKGDAEVTQAIIEQPAALSGVRDSLHDLILNEAMEAAYSPEIAELQMLEEAIDVAASAIESGRAEAHAEAAAVDPALRDPDHFNAIAASVENRTPAPWLQKFQESGAEVIRALEWDDETESKGTWKLATPEQIETGIVAKTRDEYDKLKGAAVIDFSGETAAEARRKRAAFVDEHGAEAYLNRNSGTAA
jgi:hypothetical protein